MSGGRIATLQGSRPGSAGAPRNGRPEGGYRRFGDPNWHPADLGPIEKGGREAGGRSQHEARERRLAEFAAWREKGRTVAEAAREVGVTRNTGNAYERELAARKADGS